jgi:predicted Zn-ribbon and HTH transcriptional regulator
MSQLSDALNRVGRPERVKGPYTTTGRTLDTAILSHVADRTNDEPGREQFRCPFMLCRDCGHHFGQLVWEEPRTTCGRCGSEKLVHVTLSWSR